MDIRDKCTTKGKKKCLVVGRGAMGLLHASFFEKAGFEVALIDRPDAVTHLPCGVIHLNDSKDSTDSSNNPDNIIKLDASCLTLEQAKDFLAQSAAEKALCVIFVTVKAHQVQAALTPFIDVLRNEQDYDISSESKSTKAGAPVSSVILLHNGLQNSSTVSFLGGNIGATVPIATMVTCRGSTLLLDEEKSEEYAAVARATGHGSAFIFPMVNMKEPEIGGHSQQQRISTLMKSLSVIQTALPQCTILDHNNGRCEQIIKLAINVSLNGLLARKCLKEWYESRKPSSSPTQRNHSYNNDSINVNLIQRVFNREIIPELPLARSIARLVVQKASAAEPDNHALHCAVHSDEAAQRTEYTLYSVPDNVCSTVVDIVNGRKTERDALLSTLMNDWWDEEKAMKYPKEKGEFKNGEINKNVNNCSIPLEPGRREAISALEEIDSMLRAWNEFVGDMS